MQQAVVFDTYGRATVRAHLDLIDSRNANSRSEAAFASTVHRTRAFMAGQDALSPDSATLSRP